MNEKGLIRQSDTQGVGDPKPQDPELLPCQAAFKALSDEMLKEKRNNRLSMFGMIIDTDPEVVLDTLSNSSLSDLLLENGRSLGIDNDTRFKDLGLIIGESPVMDINLVHWDWNHEKTRLIKREAGLIPPYDVISYPGEFSWVREIDIRIWYGDDVKMACQRICVYDSQSNAGLFPQVSRSVYSPSYFETGYEGHNWKYRQFENDEEAMVFVNLARELFENRAKPTLPPQPGSYLRS